MIYFVFAGLLLAGSVMATALIRMSIRVKEAVVLESRERLITKENEFRRITIQHAIEYTDDPGNAIITDAIPVHEPDGAKVRIMIDRKTGKPVKAQVASIIAPPAAMMVGALYCGFLGAQSIGVLDGLYKGGSFSYSENVIKGMVIAFAVILVLYLLKDFACILDPAVVKVKGKYEGFMHSDTSHRLTAYYSLWYGEHKQYARCTGAPLKLAADVKEQTLFFNTRRGTVIRTADIIRNVCFAILFAGAFAALAYFGF